MINNMNNKAKFYIPIEKIDKKKRMVYGYCSTEALDSQGEIVERNAIKRAWKDYMEWANIREMHQLSAVGKTKEYMHDEKGTWIGAKVVDDSAWKKVVEKVYMGFSIGGDILRKEANKIKELILTEISLVDRPACPEAEFQMVKRAAAGNLINTNQEIDIEKVNEIITNIKNIKNVMAKRKRKKKIEEVKNEETPQEEEVKDTETSTEPSTETSTEEIVDDKKEDSDEVNVENKEDEENKEEDTEEEKTEDEKPSEEVEEGVEEGTDDEIDELMEDEEEIDEDEDDDEDEDEDEDDDDDDDDDEDEDDDDDDDDDDDEDEDIDEAEKATKSSGESSIEKGVQEMRALAEIVSNLDYLVSAFKDNGRPSGVTGKMEEALSLLLDATRGETKIEELDKTEKIDKIQKVEDLNDLSVVLKEELGKMADESNARVKEIEEKVSLLTEKFDKIRKSSDRPKTSYTIEKDFSEKGNLKEEGNLESLRATMTSILGEIEKVHTEAKSVGGNPQKEAEVEAKLNDLQKRFSETKRRIAEGV